VAKCGTLSVNSSIQLQFSSCQWCCYVCRKHTLHSLLYNRPFILTCMSATSAAQREFSSVAQEAISRTISCNDGLQNGRLFRVAAQTVTIRPVYLDSGRQPKLKFSRIQMVVTGIRLRPGVGLRPSISRSAYRHSEVVLPLRTKLWSLVLKTKVLGQVKSWRWYATAARTLSTGLIYFHTT